MNPHSMVQLREYRHSDLKRLVQLLNNARVARYMANIPHPYTVQDAEWWLNVGLQREGQTTRAITILDNDDHVSTGKEHEFVGAVGAIRGTGNRAHTAEIGYWIGEPFWGRGVTAQAVQKFCDDYWKEQQDVCKLYAGVYGPNKPSMRVLEKCGWTLEAVLKKEICKDGNYYDEHRYALWRPQ